MGRLFWNFAQTSVQFCHFLCYSFVRIRQFIPEICPFAWHASKNAFFENAKNALDCSLCLVNEKMRFLMHVRQTGISREWIDGFVRNFNTKNGKTVPKYVQNFKKIGPSKRELLNFKMWLNKKDTLYN